MSHLRCVGVGLLFGALAWSWTAHAGDAPPGAPLVLDPWSAFNGGLGTVLGVLIGRAGGIPFVHTFIFPPAGGK